jgi:hypothetical protein
MNGFLIKKDSHYPSNIIQRLNPGRILLNPANLEFDFTFSHASQYAPKGLWWERRKESYYYPLLEQINKLGGISFDLINKNSARIGFRYNWETNRFYVYAYFHINGDIHYSEDSMFMVGMNERFTAQIVANREQILVQIHNNKGETKVLDIIENTFDKSLFGYIQYPYFGGKIPSPNGIKLNVDNFKVDGRQKIL